MVFLSWISGQCSKRWLTCSTPLIDKLPLSSQSASCVVCAKTTVGKWEVNSSYGTPRSSFARSFASHFMFGYQLVCPLRQQLLRGLGLTETTPRVTGGCQHCLRHSAESQMSVETKCQWRYISINKSAMRFTSRQGFVHWKVHIFWICIKYEAMYSIPFLYVGDAAKK